MGQIRTITAHFTSERRYFENSLGKEFDFTASTGPYEYLLGALSGCFYLTILSLEHKSRWGNVDIEVIGNKRSETPTTLEKTTLLITVHDAQDKEEFESLVEKATKACSVYTTISAVSEMEWKIEYK